MSVKITELGVVVPGKITRKFDQGANRTTLTLTEGQAREIAQSLELALGFFDAQGKTS